MIPQNWQDIQNVTDLPSLVRYTRMDLQQILTILTGNIGFLDNCSTQLLNVNFPKVGVTYQFPHTLGRVPSGFLNAGMSASSVVYNGNQANTVTSIYLQANNATGSGKVLVF